MEKECMLERERKRREPDYTPQVLSELYSSTGREKLCGLNVNSMTVHNFSHLYFIVLKSQDSRYVWGNCLLQYTFKRIWKILLLKGIFKYFIFPYISLFLQRIYQETWASLSRIHCSKLDLHSRNSITGRSPNTMTYYPVGSSQAHTPTHSQRDIADVLFWTDWEGFCKHFTCTDQIVVRIQVEQPCLIQGSRTR